MYVGISITRMTLSIETKLNKSVNSSTIIELQSLINNTKHAICMKMLDIYLDETS